MITNIYYLLDQVIRDLSEELRKHLIIFTMKKIKPYEFKSVLTKYTENSQKSKPSHPEDLEFWICMRNDYFLNLFYFTVFTFLYFIV